MIDNYYIYIYLDPRKLGQYCYNNICFLFEPIYVGKGKDNRWKDKNKRTNLFKNKINKIKKSGLEPIILKLYENLNEDQSFETEKQLIKEIGRINSKTGLLVNMTDGGEGSSGLIFSKEHRKKLSERKKGKVNPNFGKSPSEETRNKQRKKMMNINNYFFGKHHTENNKKRINMIRKEKFKNGELNFKGNNSPNHKLTEDQVIQIKLLLKEGMLTQQEIADMFQIKRETVSAIKNGKIWSYIKIGEN
jgi:group I intron endonuclease